MLSLMHIGNNSTHGVNVSDCRTGTLFLATKLFVAHLQQENHYLLRHIFYDHLPIPSLHYYFGFHWKINEVILIVSSTKENAGSPPDNLCRPFEI